MGANAKIKNHMPVLTFPQLFRVVDDNTLQVLRKIKIGSVGLDADSTITRGTLIGGLDFFKYIPLDATIEGDEAGDTWVLRKVKYQRNEQ